eukprot:CAMPEP_0119302246 /NCGR_PEP_ID=MMETSP1333-20130426/3879_1 /TAXON_ID=418940 /ORGANISM="Scyphosphaera apsteinii, Strain RCC1455" /LENGTH=249 /DNA_ID=CAMNT_0007304545 /DNA_START=17 /DNA_END=763 /DNA_ORIENTATION=+
MSLLGSSARSDSLGSLTVHACAVARTASEGCATAGFHCRLPGSVGAKLQQAMSSTIIKSFSCDKPFSDESRINGESITVHCIHSKELLFLVCTLSDYPKRVVFGSGHNLEAAEKGLLPQLANEIFDLVGLDLSFAADDGIKTAKLSSRALQAMERVCADYEAPAKYDSVSSVQAQVDDVRDIMQQNVQNLLQNQDQLTELQRKAEATRTYAGAFSKAATVARREVQWKDHKVRLFIGVGAFSLVALILW